MRDVTLPENTVETLIDAARLGVQLLQDQVLTQAEGRYERNNVFGQIRRTEDAIQDAEWQSMLSEFTTSSAEQMSVNAEKKRKAEDMSSFSEDKMNFIEGKR